MLTLTLMHFSILASTTKEPTTLSIETLENDYLSFYSSPNLIRLGATFMAGAVLANTTIDRNLNNWYQRSLRSPHTNQGSRIFQVFGNKTEVLLGNAMLITASMMLKNSPSGRSLKHFSQKNIEALAVGTPLVLLMQQLLGGGSPITHQSSGWQPFKHSKGVSGHAFLGATPFLTAAKLTDSPITKSLFYALSIMPGLSRINDEAHYSSQVMLGWMISYLAVNSVFSKKLPDHTQLNPYLSTHGTAGILITKRFS